MRNRILDLLYPPQLYCLSCGALIDGTRTYGLCDACITKFSWVSGRTCEKCGKPLPAESLHAACYDCRTEVHRFDKGCTCASYGLYERLLISDFKERGKDYAGRAIAEAMYDRLQEAALSADLLTAVPAGKWKTASRGYDQTKIVAQQLASRLHIPYRELLVRTRRTQAMRTLSAGERHSNVQGAFSILKGRERIIQGRAILLLDDVYTTGSTLDACAGVLKDAGAQRVDVLTFAAGADMHPAFEEGDSERTRDRAQDAE